MGCALDVREGVRVWASVAVVVGSWLVFFGLLGDGGDLDDLGARQEAHELLDGGVCGDFVVEGGFAFFVPFDADLREAIVAKGAIFFMGT